MNQGMIEKVVEMSTKLITFIDFGGHKNEKHMVTCLCSHSPDYTAIVINASQEVSKATVESIQMLEVFNLPFILVLTHIDMITEEQLFKVVQVL